MFDLGGKVALVTGAGRGVGAGIAELLARQGAAVAVNDLVGERAEAVAARIGDEGGRAAPTPFDVTDARSVQAGVAAASGALGPPDILVNNAGVPAEMALARFRDLPREKWRPFVDINLYGVLHCTKAVVEGMVERGFGRIVTISSGAGQVGIPIGVSIYGAAKAGALGFMRHLAVELAATGVTANSLALGLMNNAPSDAIEAVAKTVPARRLGTPEDAAAAVVFLASEEASWITGQVLGVNGGSITA